MKLGENLVIALRVALVTLVVTGVLYPLAMTGLAQGLFPSKANGSLARDQRGTVVGSALLAQAFASPAYFQPRPSAAGHGYDPLASGGSNYGTLSRALAERLAGDVVRLRRENPDAPGPIPDELVTVSASGLDPHISPDTALWQVPRVAKARGLAPARVTALVRDRIEGRDLGLLGEPRINVLQLNLALDRRFGMARP